MGAALDKPYDRFFKSISEQAPRLLLHLLGILALDVETAVEMLPRETSPPVKITDYVALVSAAADDPFIFHTEFVVRYKSVTPSEMARYGGSLIAQYLTPVVSVLVLIRPKGAPKAVPDEGVFQIGKTRTIHPFRTVRFWEVDPAPVLNQPDPRLLPWAILMNTSDAQVRGIAAALLRHGDDELLGQFSALGVLRYDKKELNVLMGGPKMGIMEAILKESWLGDEIREKAEEAGRQGGQRAEARKMLKSALRVKFPDLETLPALDSLPTVALEALFENVLRSDDRAEMERAIQDAATSTVS